MRGSLTVAALLAGTTLASASIDNTASVNGTFGPSAAPLYDPTGATAPVPPTDDATVPLATPTPSYIATKTVSDPDDADVGDVLTYEISIENTGNVSLQLGAGGISDPGPSFDGGTTNEALTSAFAFDSARDTNADLVGDGGDVNGDGQISPGETWFYIASYTLTQNDIDASAGVTDGVTNVATVDVEDIGGGAATEDPATDLDAEATIDLRRGLALVKDAFDTAYSDDGVSTNDGAIITTGTAGQTVYYRFTVTNNSNVTVAGVSISEDAFTLNTTNTPNGTLSAIALVGGSATLAPGEEAVFEATYVIQQADIDD